MYDIIDKRIRNWFVATANNFNNKHPTGELSISININTMSCCNTQYTKLAISSLMFNGTAPKVIIFILIFVVDVVMSCHKASK